MIGSYKSTTPTGGKSDIIVTGSKAKPTKKKWWAISRCWMTTEVEVYTQERKLAGAECLDVLCCHHWLMLEGGLCLSRSGQPAGKQHAPVQSGFQRVSMYYYVKLQLLKANKDDNPMGNPSVLAHIYYCVFNVRVWFACMLHCSWHNGLIDAKSFWDSFRQSISLPIIRKRWTYTLPIGLRVWQLGNHIHVYCHHLHIDCI